MEEMQGKKTTTNSKDSEDKREVKRKNQLEQRRKKFLQRYPEVLPLQDALDHLVVTGAKIRRDNWRRREFFAREVAPVEAEAEAEAGTFDDDDDYNDEMGSQDSERTPRTGSSRLRPSTSTTSTDASRTQLLHAEDIRIYGNNSTNPFKRGLPMKPWPSTNECNTKKRQKRNNVVVDDTEWDIEHGDSIPLLLFRMARLSQEQHRCTSATEEGIVYQNEDPLALARMKSLQSTNITVDQKHVPRALLERCWERAVHASSTAIAVGHNKKENNINSSSSSSRSHHHKYHHQQTKRRSEISCLLQPSLDNNQSSLSQQELCRIKCKSLSIDIESESSKITNKPTTMRRMNNTTSATTIGLAPAEEEITLSTEIAPSCPRCCRSFLTKDELESHYYGGEKIRRNESENDNEDKDDGNDNTYSKGCCWPLIRPRYLSLIGKLLQNHVQSQTDLLMTVVMAQAAAATTLANRNKDKKPNCTSDVVINAKKKNVCNSTQSKPSIMNWKDVSTFLQVTVDDTVAFDETESAEVARHPVLESLQIHTDVCTTNNESKHETSASSSSSLSPPLLINKMVIDAASRRLINRYANVPR